MRAGTIFIAGDVCDDLLKIVKRCSAKNGIEQPEYVIQQTTAESLFLSKYKTATLALFTI